MSRWVVLLLLVLGACATSRATAPDLGLADRFEMVAFALAEERSFGDERDGPTDELWRFDGQIAVHYIGPDEYREDVYRFAQRLGELAGRRVIIEPDFTPTFIVEISDRHSPYTCSVRLGSLGDDWSAGYGAHVLIGAEYSPRYIRQCIIQEMTQGLGLIGDLDGLFGSRSDTVFASYQTADDLSAEDIALIKILYDPRLADGMTRERVMPIVRQIVAEMEQDAERTRLP